ncbi:hypothetical protein ACO0QE_003796 [Hanseniaspora vineae]
MLKRSFYVSKRVYSSTFSLEARTATATASSAGSSAKAASLDVEEAQIATSQHTQHQLTDASKHDTPHPLKHYIDVFRSGVTDVDLTSTFQANKKIETIAQSQQLKPLYHMAHNYYAHKLEKLREAEYICHSMDECNFLNREIVPGVGLHEIPKLVEYCIQNDAKIKNVMFFWKLLVGDNVAKFAYPNKEFVSPSTDLYLEDMLRLCEKLFQMKAFVQSMDAFKYIFEHYLGGKFVVNARFLTMYLKIRTGTYIEYSWKELSSLEHNFKKYALNQNFLVQDVSQVIEYIQEQVLDEDGPWSLERNSELESNIIYFIAMHQPEALDSYIDHVYMNETAGAAAASFSRQIDTNILLSVVNSYYHLQDLGKGLHTMNKLIEHNGGYHKMDFSVKFWNQLFLIGQKATKHDLDPDLDICMNVWKLLKQKIETKSVQETSCLSCIPFYQLLKDPKTKHPLRYKLLLDIFETFIKPCHLKLNIDTKLRQEERHLMKSIFKTLIKMKMYKNSTNCLEMIELYNLGYKVELLECFHKARSQDLEKRKLQKQREKTRSKLLREDADMEDKMLGGGLW